MGSEANTGLPSLDCLLAASVVLHSEPTGDTRFLVLNSHKNIQSSISVMLSEAPLKLKIIYVESSPETTDEVDLLRQDGLSVYIYDHHVTAFGSLLQSSPNIVYTRSATSTMTNLLSNLYPGAFAHNRLWPRIALLNYFISFHRFIEPLNSELEKESGFAYLSRDLDSKYQHFSKTRTDWLGALVYVSDYVSDQLSILNRSFAIDDDQSDLFDRAGQFIGHILAVHSFLETLVAGDDTSLVSDQQIERFHDNVRRCRAAVADGHLVSINVSGSLFVGAIVLKHGSFKMAPNVALLLDNRSKAQCLIDIEFEADEEKEEEDEMRMCVQRSRPKVDCREVALSLASGMGEGAVVWGQPHEARLVCTREDYRMLARRLKMDRELVTWRPPNDAPEPPPKSPPSPLQRQVSARRLPSPTAAAPAPVGVPVSARVRTRAGQSTGISDNLYD